MIQQLVDWADLLYPLRERWLEFRADVHAAIDARWRTWRSLEGSGCACGWQQTGAMHATGRQALIEQNKRFWAHVKADCPLKRDDDGMLIR